MNDSFCVALSVSLTSPHHLPDRDAPAISTYLDGPSGVTSLSAISALSGAGRSDPKNGNNLTDGNEQWDDEALAAATTRKNAATVAIPSSAVTSRDLTVDIKALDLKGSYNDEQDIAERLRVEETRAQLAAAREGMAREAQRVKEEKEKKELAATSRMGGAGAAGGSGGDTGGKWVPSRLRAGGSSLTTAERFGMAGMSSSSSQRVNTEDENLFPDLAAAEAIIEKQKHEQPAFMAPKKTPVGGGATWGSRPKLNLKPKSTTATAGESQESTNNGLASEEPVGEDALVNDDAAAGADASAETEEQSAVEAHVIEAPDEEMVSSSTPEPSTIESSGSDVATSTAPAPAPIKPKKKKKKDLSTFKK
jgi:hypothetical protein